MTIKVWKVSLSDRVRLGLDKYWRQNISFLFVLKIKLQTIMAGWRESLVFY